MDKSAYEQAAEQFLQQVMREYYANLAGLQPGLDLAAIYARHADLFTRDAIEGLRTAGIAPEEREYLVEFAIEGYLDNQVRELSERLVTLETTTLLSWEGEQVPYRAVPSLIANEPRVQRRHELDQRRREAAREMNRLQQERWALLHEQARALGYASYVEMSERSGGLHLEQLVTQMRELLEKTETAYFSLLPAYLQRVDLRPGEAWKADMAAVFRARDYDRYFGRDTLLAVLRITLAGLGVDLDAQKNVHLDVEARPAKSPRAFCAAIRVPEEVYLVINPRGGQDDYQALLHEAGHTEHFAFTDPRLPFAFRRLGDNSVTEGFAFQLQHLTQNRAWLTDVLRFPDPDDYLAFADFVLLYMLRRYATKLLYELELHRAGPGEEQARLYADLLTRNLGVVYPEEDYLSDVDDRFYAARYLRAWLLEVHVTDYVARRFGNAWFTQKRAGSLLKDLWHLGQRYRAEELVRELGFAELSLDPLLERLPR